MTPVRSTVTGSVWSNSLSTALEFPDAAAGAVENIGILVVSQRMLARAV